MSDINADCTLPIEIDCVYDLRKYISGGKTKGLTNMVSKIALPFEFKPQEEFTKTVLKVHKKMEEFKGDYPAMDGLSLLRLCFFIVRPPTMRKAIFNKVFINPMTALSNIGIIPENVINYGNIKVDDFFVTGAIKYHPYILLSLFTFRNRLTFSIAIEGCNKDFDNAQKLLDTIKFYLSSLI